MPGLTIGVYADASGITITDGEREQRVAIKRWRAAAGCFVSFLCPQCQRGCYQAVLAGCPMGLSNLPSPAARYLASAPLEENRPHAYA